MTNQSEGRTLFANMVSRKEENIELAKAALLFAKEGYTDLNIDRYLREMELIVEEIKRRARHNTNPSLLISEIDRYLFTEIGFEGNERR